MEYHVMKELSTLTKAVYLHRHGAITYVPDECIENYLSCCCANSIVDRLICSIRHGMRHFRRSYVINRRSDEE